jgi:hypothetical protein
MITISNCLLSAPFDWPGAVVCYNLFGFTGLLWDISIRISGL